MKYETSAWHLFRQDEPDKNRMIQQFNPVDPIPSVNKTSDVHPFFSILSFGMNSSVSMPGMVMTQTMMKNVG